MGNVCFKRFALVALCVRKLKGRGINGVGQGNTFFFYISFSVFISNLIQNVKATKKRGEGTRETIMGVSPNSQYSKTTTASRSVTHISDEVSKHKISFWEIATMKVLYNIKH